MMTPLQIEQITLNAPLPWNVYDGDGRLLLRKGFTVSERAQLQALQSRGVFILGELVQQLAAGPSTPAEEHPFDACRALEALLGRAMKEELPSAFLSAMDTIAHKLRSIALKRFDAASAFLMLGDGHNYPVVHQLHTAMVVAALLPRVGEYDEQQQLSIIKAALSMNISMLALQAMLFHQDGRLTLEQQTSVRSHPLEGVQRLKRLGVEDALWLQTVLEHHENTAGTGYPKAIEQPCLAAQLVNLADVFCAKVIARGYRRAITPNQAAKALFAAEGAGAQSSLAALLIKETGVYPPGTFVKLANKEVGLVVRRGNTAVTPTVAVLVSADGMPTPDPVIRDTMSKEFAITGVMPKEKVPVNVPYSKLFRR